MTKRIVVLVSGRGSNMEAIIQAIEEGQINGQVVGVVSNRLDAPAIERCRARAIPCVVVDKQSFYSKGAFEAELLRVCTEFAPDLICLAGFMHILGPDFIAHFRGRIMNIHPSLLPSFMGLHAQKQAVEYGVKVSGCTVHFVDEGMDTGPIIMQAVVPVREDDSPESLAARILVEEHRIYSKAVELFCAGRLRLESRKVITLE